MARNGRGAPSPTVNALKAQAGSSGKGDAAPLAFTKAMGAHHPEDDETWKSSDTARTLTGFEGGPARASTLAAPVGTVRRLTPTETERLQGFPDGWTALVK